jgi:DNA-binding PadR family transcriptional regulator
MERKLLLLGLLRGHEMHGYQLNEFIDSHLEAIVHLKKPTAYRLLARMADDGWVTYREEREGNRPPRRVFAITPEGEAAFQRLLRQCLADYQPIDFRRNIGLLFLHAVPSDEAVELLQNRRASVAGVLKRARAHQGHDEGSALMLSHQTRHLATELEWLDQVIIQFVSQASRSSDHSHGGGQGAEEDKLS